MSELPPSEERELSPAVSTSLAVLFWLSLGLSGCLLACVVLSPYRLEQEQLWQRYLRNGLQMQAWSRETTHLSRLVQALRTDEDFRERIASQELKRPGDATVRVPVSPSLGYDARQLAEEPAEINLEPAWYLPLLVPVAGPARTRVMLAACGLLLLAMSCFNDAFFSGGAGRWLRRQGSRLLLRYRLPGEQMHG